LDRTASLSGVERVGNYFYRRSNKRVEKKRLGRGGSYNKRREKRDVDQTIKKERGEAKLLTSWTSLKIEQSSDKRMAAWREMCQCRPEQAWRSKKRSRQRSTLSDGARHDTADLKRVSP